MDLNNYIIQKILLLCHPDQLITLFNVFPNLTIKEIQNRIAPNIAWKHKLKFNITPPQSLVNEHYFDFKSTYFEFRYTNFEDQTPINRYEYAFYQSDPNNTIGSHSIINHNPNNTINIENFPYVRVPLTAS